MSKAGRPGGTAGLHFDPSPALPTVTHAQLHENGNDEIYGGWPMILSALKTLLETGEL